MRTLRAVHFHLMGYLILVFTAIRACVCVRACACFTNMRVHGYGPTNPAFLPGHIPATHQRLLTSGTAVRRPLTLALAPPPSRVMCSLDTTLAVVPREEHLRRGGSALARRVMAPQASGSYPSAMLHCKVEKNYGFKTQNQAPKHKTYTGPPYPACSGRVYI